LLAIVAKLAILWLADVVAARSSEIVNLKN
jgi:hypothetical protein